MEAFVKSFLTYRTIKKSTVISSALTIDSLEKDNTTITVVGTDIGRSDTGNWLIVDGSIFWISNVKPQGDRTLLTLLSPLDAFSRPLQLPAVPSGQTVGGFVEAVLRDNWVLCNDPVYSMTYLVVSSLDTTAYAPPELDNSGCFNLPDYCRLMRKSYRVTIRFRDAGAYLSCSIDKIPVAEKQVSFEDGRSQLQSVDYSSSGVAKITALLEVNTGKTDPDGLPIMATEESIWYLSENGEVSQTVPSRRASGTWTTILVKQNGDVETKVIEAFAKNKANHKLEFWSDLDLSVQDDCTFLVYGELLQSYISCKRKTSEDKRFYYKSGELATTATEKLRGVTK